MIDSALAGLPDLGGVATALLDAADTMVVVTDRDGTIVYVNPAFTAVTGYAREEAIGATPRLLRSGVQDDAFYADLWGTVLAGATWHGELVNRRKDGSLYTDEMTIVPLEADGRRPTHFMAIKRDVSTRIQTLTAASPVGVAHAGRDGRLLYVNGRAETMLGAGFGDLIGHGWTERLHPEDAAAVLGDIEAAFTADPAADPHERRVQLPGGNWLEIHGAPLVEGGGARLGVVLALDDVTAEVVATAALHQREQFTRAILNSLSDATVVIDGGGTIVAVNRSWERFGQDNAGDPRDVGVGADYFAVCRDAAALGGHDGTAVEAALRQVLAGERDFYEFEYTCPSGAEGRWYLQRITPLEGSEGAVLAHIDITWRKQAELRLADASSHDQLTGLLNRRALEAERGPVQALLFIDLDGFKTVNDTLGHGAGDEVLVCAAERIRSQTRGADRVARVGGDEFVVLLSPDPHLDAAAVAARIEAAVAAPYDVTGGVVRIGASVGMTDARPGEPTETLISRADAEMYEIKKAHHAGRTASRSHSTVILSA